MKSTFASETDPSPEHGGEAGFTLVEVIAALAILALSLGVLLTVISDGLRHTGQAERAAEAASLAQSLLAQVGADVPVRAGQTTGQFANGFRWRLRMEASGDPTDRQQLRVGAFRVAADVIWDDGLNERTISLTTLRLGPAGPAR